MGISQKFIDNLVIDELSSTPKYQQLSNAIIAAIKNGILTKGDPMPSINELSFSHDISRITVEKGYNELRDLGILEAYPGKGYFVKNTDIFQELKIFLMFNKLSEHKKIIYDSFVQTLGDKASIDFYIYNNDSKLFSKLIENKLEGGYTHFVIIPHFIEGEKTAYQTINKIPKNKLIIVDKLIPEVSGNFGAVYENFSKNIYHALFQALEALQKFSMIKLIFPEQSYYPYEIIEGFVAFCQSFVFEYKIINDIINEDINKGDVFINLMEDDLIKLLDKVTFKGFAVGSDVGIISYNETKTKKYIMNGLTTISTDFAEMGKRAAELILTGSKKHIENPFNVTFRDSLK
ncbi:MAG: GntR family transcriptional regulator [Spirosomataceae bacterium]